MANKQGAKAADKLAAVILAAGKGTRMKSTLPKVVHQVGGRPMVAHVLDLARTMGADPVIVVHPVDGQRITDAIRGVDPKTQFAVQDPPLGTGHARCVVVNVSTNGG